jgi:hypothetical protein
MSVNKIESYLLLDKQILRIESLNSVFRIVKIVRLMDSLTIFKEDLTVFFVHQTHIMLPLLCKHLRAYEENYPGVPTTRIKHILNILQNLLIFSNVIPVFLVQVENLIPSLWIAFQVGCDEIVINSILKILLVMVENSNTEQFVALFNACLDYDFTILISNGSYKRMACTTQNEITFDIFILLFQKSDNTQIYYLLTQDCLQVILISCLKNGDEDKQVLSIQCLLKVLCGFWSDHYEYNLVKSVIQKSRICKLAHNIKLNSKGSSLATEILSLLVNSWGVNIEVH